MTSAGTSYDEVPYESFAIPQTQPDRLAALATLFSLEVTPPARARVLEIGCAAGGNLIPLACRYPQAQFVGIDLSARQIAEGRRDAAALGLGNLELIERNLMDVDDSLGRFDYVIAHGVYSWIPAPARKKLLEACAAGLSATGVAYVSYNTLPGWHMRGAIRDMMRFHVEQFAQPAQRAAQARALLAFLAAALGDDKGAYATMLREELKMLEQSPDFYLLHDHLEEENEPVYFHQFFKQAAAAGLQYLCEEKIADSIPGMLFKPEVLETLRRVSPDLMRMEQYSDFLRNRVFRCSLLVAADRAPQRTFSLGKIVSLRVASQARPDGGNADIHSVSEVNFAARGGSITTSTPITKAALGVLARRWPEPMAFADLFGQASAELGRAGPQPALASNPEYERLATELLHAFCYGVAGLHCEPGSATCGVSGRPVAFAAARHYAAAGRKRLPNTLHEALSLDPYSIQLLKLLDGTRDTAALVEEMVRSAQSGAMTVKQGETIVTDPDTLRKVMADTVPRVLFGLRDFAFLVG